MRLLVRIVVTALAFVWILPLIDGIQFRGSFFEALFLAVLFGVMVWLVDAIAIALSAITTISTFGAALLWLIPLWVLGFWLLPAVALKMVSDIMPHTLVIHGWFPSILGGLVLMFIGLITSRSTRRQQETAY